MLETMERATGAHVLALDCISHGCQSIAGTDLRGWPKRCEKTWRVQEAWGAAPRRHDADEDRRYRQHRCGLESPHVSRCVCRYCQVPA